MAKTTKTKQTEQTEAEGTASDTTKKQRKKQAKREAKMMLKVELARKDVQKAEQKAAKAQAVLESSKTHLSKLEAKMQEMDAPSTSSSTTTEAPEPAEEQSTSTSASENDAEEPGKGDSATFVTELEQPALLSPEVAHTGTNTDTAETPTEAQSTIVEENSEDASAAQDETGDGDHMEETQESSTAE